MSRVWKWVLGILGVLILVGLVAGAIFMWRNHMYFWEQRAAAPGVRPGTTAPYDYDRLPRYHMRAWGGHMPMMYGGPGYPYGNFGMGFMLFAGLFRLLIPLGVLALVAYVFYGMGKRAGSSPARPAPRPDVQPLPARKVARR